jgi:two-component system sensor histidine kinase MtrB
VSTIAFAAGVPVVTRLPAEPVRIEMDARRIERILRNLLANAIDHAEGHPVVLELAADESSAAIVVSDSGVGLKPGEAGLVFNRFWRADPSRQRQTGGTGLGLAIALEDARLHGGWLQAFGRPGQGSRFRLTLPRAQGTLITSSPLPLDPDEESETAGSDSRDLYSQLPPAPHTPGLEGYFTQSALSTLSSGFSEGAAADPAEPGREPS